MLKVGGIYNFGEYYITIIEKNTKLQLVYYYILFFDNIESNIELNEEIKKIDNYNLKSLFVSYNEERIKENIDGYLGELTVENLKKLQELRKKNLIYFLYNQ